MSESPAPTTSSAADKDKGTTPPPPAAATTTAAAAEGTSPAPTSEHINLKVVGQDGNEVFFKIKKHTALRKLTEAYCQRQGVSPSSIRFLYDGRRIQPDQTPKELGMEDGDVIDAMLHQTGGCF